MKRLSPLRGFMRLGGLPSAYALGYYISPLRGFRYCALENLGLTRWAITFRPSGAFVTALSRTLVLRAGLLHFAPPGLSLLRYYGSPPGAPSLLALSLLYKQGIPLVGAGEEAF